MKELGYRPCVGAMVINKENKVFVGKRIDTTTESWQMPQGGIDEGEDAQTALLRELSEEIGTDNVEVLSESSDWLTYDLPQELIGKIWGGRYRGQKQKWFAVRFCGSDNEINIKTKHPEFNSWKWVKAETLPDLIVPFKRQLYIDVLAEFKDILV